MTHAEMAAFIAANPEVDRAELCVLIHTPDGWALVVGETQSDGVFRHVDMVMEAGTVETATTALRTAQPRGRIIMDALALPRGSLVQ